MVNIGRYNKQGGAHESLGRPASCRGICKVKPAKVEFNRLEKLGVLKAIDQVLRVDDRIYEGESFFVSQLSRVIDFDREIFERAGKMELDDAIKVLRDMPDHKKEALAVMLNEAANADGKVQEEELRTIQDIFSRAGVDFENF